MTLIRDGGGGGNYSAFVTQLFLRQDAPLSRHHEQNFGINSPAFRRSLDGQTRLFQHLVADFFGLKLEEFKTEPE